MFPVAEGQAVVSSQRKEAKREQVKLAVKMKTIVARNRSRNVSLVELCARVCIGKTIANEWLSETSRRDDSRRGRCSQVWTYVEDPEEWRV